MRETVIVSACRTPIGSFGGTLSSLSATRLGAMVVAEAVRRAALPPAEVQEVIMGNVLTAGEGQAPARQAALFGGLPDSVECLTINKVCGSGLKAVMLASQAIALGDADVIIAGGMESMSNVPYLLDKARTGYRMGHGEVVDALIKDGLWDVYNNFHMGSAAELCAKECAISRKAQDEFAIASYTRAQDAQASGKFAAEIVPVMTPQRNGPDLRIDTDEEPGKAKFEKIPQLRPAFQPDGSVTAANASKISDGAAALTLMASEQAARLHMRPLARIVASASSAKKPEWFTTAPADAITKVLAKAGLTLQDIDLFEINEAFAVVTLAAMKTLDISPDRVNVRGGAIALGHPIGASGARILVTLLHTLRQRGLKRGLATLCIGGGEASALIVECM